MDQDIAALAAAIKARRAELGGLSQAAIASRGGPSTTTLSKILTGKANHVFAHTLDALDRSLGWRAGSASNAVYRRGEPVAAIDPATLIPEDDPPPSESDETLMSVRMGRDDRGLVAIGWMTDVDDEGVRSRTEVRFWPGEGRSVVTTRFLESVTKAHEIATSATSVYRPSDSVAAPFPLGEPSIKLVHLKGAVIDADDEARSPTPN